jgi:hypothetical protein
VVDATTLEVAEKRVSENGMVLSLLLEVAAEVRILRDTILEETKKDADAIVLGLTLSELTNSTEEEPLDDGTDDVGEEGLPRLELTNGKVTVAEEEALLFAVDSPEEAGRDNGTLLDLTDEEPGMEDGEPLAIFVEVKATTEPTSLDTENAERPLEDTTLLNCALTKDDERGTKVET